MMLRTTLTTLDNSFGWEGGTKTVQMPAEMRTPRPTPQFFNQQQTFSTKKDRGYRGTPRDCQPPRPPVKSAPPISRIFPHKPAQKAQPVTFKQSDTSILSTHYNEGSQDLYFDQCFEIENKIGVGAFGEVFKVRSKEDGKYYAIKRSRERFRGESDRKRKLEEVAKHEKLPKHPNCVRFFKAWEEKQHLYIQTELCKTSLSDLADSNHHIPEQLVWNYLVDLLMALKHLHDNELVHMDVKPENIFISDTDTCKLGDFGLVLDLAKGIDMSEAQEGDPQYLSPELMMGKFSKAADIFSLGITILELASDLDLPRGGDLWHDLRSGHLPDHLLAGVSEELRHVIHWMMTPDPDRRPTADCILQLPYVQKIWRRRRREQALRSIVSSVNTLVQSVMCLFMTLWMTVTYPLHNVVPYKVSTPKKSDAPRHPPDWDHSFSDDDLAEEINISNNSLGAPLNFSTSSEESFTHDGFAIPSVPMRQAKTTPGYRYRQMQPCTPQSAGSPVLSSLGSRFSSSPLTSPPVSSYRLHDQSITPNSSFHQSLIEEDPPVRLNIEPKNLLEAFERSSSEDD